MADRFSLTNLGQRGGTHAGERAEPNRPTPPTVGAYEPMPGFKTPWGPGVTGSWSDKPFPIKGKLPVNSAKFKNTRGRIPTTIVATDPRKVTL